MVIPTKEELEKERDEFGLTTECPDFRFGGEAEGILEFSKAMAQFRISEADKTFLNYLVWGSYPYDMEGLVDSWDENVLRNRDRDYTDSQRERMALNWFDRRLGKLVRIGILDCSINLPYLGSFKKAITFSKLSREIKNKFLLDIGENNAKI